MPPSQDLAALRESLASAKSVVILAGAGLSAASGIPTYRSFGGLWTSRDPSLVATPQAFKDDPSRVWQFFHLQRAACLSAKPNAAHHALASLTLPPTRNRLLPSLSTPHIPPLLITQNVDGLSSRALEALTPRLSKKKDEAKIAQERLIEMHGSAFKTICTTCGHIAISRDSPLCPALGTCDGRDIPVEDLPRCGGSNRTGSNRYGRCGGLLRPAIVWFGEIPEGMGEIARVLNWTDFLIVVGTSSVVQPAAGFAKTVKSRGGKVAIFNLERTAGDDDADFLVLGPCEVTIPAVFEDPSSASKNSASNLVD